MEKRKPTQHSMQRRSAVHDYSRPGFYHIIMHVAQGMGLPLGRVVGSDADSAKQSIMDEVVRRGFSVVLIADNGFPEVYHPSTERIDRCAEGRLLIVTPWKYHYRRKDEGITLIECKTMNCVAQALCHRRDDWWK